MKKSQDIKLTIGRIVQALDEMNAHGDIEVIETTSLLDPGKMTLVSGSNADSNVYLANSVN